MKLPLISIIMPVYNSEKYIRRAIESILSQTYSNIELVIGYDSSSDRTEEIISSYCSNKIVLCHNNENPGSCYYARELAFKSSRGDYVVLLDSDDYIEKCYIEKIYKRLISCDADVCCGKMVLVNENGIELEKKESVPNNSFDFSIRLSGRESFFYTVPDWKIAMNGCIAKRQLWNKALIKNYRQGYRGLHSDENFSRCLLLCSNIVVFENIKYFYTVNSQSLTHTLDNRIFDFMVAEDDLLKLIEKDFGRNCDEYRAVECSDFNAYLHSLSLFIVSVSSLNQKEISYYIRKFEKWHNRLNWQLLKDYLGIKRFLFHSAFKIELMLILLRKRKLFFFLLLVSRSINSRLFISNKYIKWYLTRKQRESSILKQLVNNYNNSSISTDLYQNFVINIIDGTINSGGLADRLRGIISTYAICKEFGLKYKLSFTSPFNLQEYLKPAEYDWKVDCGDICRNFGGSEIIILDTTDDSSYQYNKQKKYLETKLRCSRSQQIHVYTNAAFSYSLNYSSLFRELFKPSERLRKSLDEQRKILGEEYLSISARFLDLLGDFNETCGYGVKLNEYEVQELVSSSLRQIEIIHNKFPDKKILVNSDSRKFLDAVASKFDFTYSIPGTITHIDHKNNLDNYLKYEKTFLDFFMIACASKIFLLKGNLMHRSGYPYAASKIYNKEFYVIEY